MSDLQRLKKELAEKNPKSWEGYDKRFDTFELGILLKQARVEAGLTQKQVADQLHTYKSVISRMEKFAKAIGRDIRIALV